jgi:hypothetical protein
MTVQPSGDLSSPAPAEAAAGARKVQAANTSQSIDTRLLFIFLSLDPPFPDGAVIPHLGRKYIFLRCGKSNAREHGLKFTII